MMLQPTQVLPSNASPVYDADNDRASRVVLQEHSGNRQYMLQEVPRHSQHMLQENSRQQQHHDYSYVEDLEQKCPPPSNLTEYHYAGHQPRQHLHDAVAYQQTSMQRYRNRFGHSRHRVAYDERAHMNSVRKEANIIWQRFAASDGYTKYRQKQARDDNKREDQKWPDNLEMCFFQALVLWKPMGRHKLSYKGKQRGRNELIADFIMQETGEKRDRKQVSSHIQVLKPFTRGDPEIMKYFSQDGPAPLRGHRFGHRERGQTSRYPVTAPPHDMYNGCLPIPRLETRGWTSSRAILGSLEPLSFEMFVQQKDGPGSVKRLHTYTTSTEQPLSSDHHVQDWSTLNTAYPHLAKMHEKAPLNCNVVAAQASLALTMETWKDQRNVELGISFSCRGHQLRVGAKVTCSNRFYKDGNCVTDSFTFDDVPLHATEQGCVEAQVKFGSTFWARSLAGLASTLRNTADPMTGISNSWDEVRRSIDGITATQEFSVQDEHSKPKRLMVVLWNFQLSSGIAGEASWHRLILPSTNPTSHDEPWKQESLDSLMDAFPNDDPSPSYQTQPELQSPFEYEQDSSSGSALTSATWQTSFDDGLHTAPASAVDFTGDNNLDFTGGTINVSYNNTDFDFSTFDSSAFNYDTTADFMTDPILEHYSQTDYSTQYCDSYVNSFDTQQPMSASDTSFAMTAIDSQSQNVFESFGEPYDQSFSVGHESQAYGGAGQEVIKEEDPLAALADASYMVSGALTQEEHPVKE